MLAIQECNPSIQKRLWIKGLAGKVFVVALQYTNYCHSLECFEPLEQSLSISDCSMSICMK